MNHPEAVEPVDPDALSPAATMPARTEYDAAVTGLATDVSTVEGEPERVATAVTNFNEADRGFWDSVGDWFTGLVDDIEAAIAEFATTVSEFFELVSTFDQGMPYDMYAAGEAYLEAQAIFSGQVLNLSAWNLTAANGTWTGDNANTYRAGILAQAAALTKLQTWCGDAGGVLMGHARNVVGTYLDMRLDLAMHVNSLYKSISDLVVTDPSKFLGLVQKICVLALDLLTIMANISTSFEKWANESLKSIDTMKLAMANQTGTDAGTWPSFVSA